ncbi:MAG: hypothetical protein H7A35_08830 [Planctomycetales bacterium]|nr:hypothetical protein [bacterium]UNM06982.1 MAG: hypothetical protein H7A35_08830 [Planctomycetales bacterium]
MQYGDSWITENEHLLGGGQPDRPVLDPTPPCKHHSGFASVEILRRFAAECRALNARMMLDKALQA